MEYWSTDRNRNKRPQMTILLIRFQIVQVIAPLVVVTFLSGRCVTGFRLKFNLIIANTGRWSQDRVKTVRCEPGLRKVTEHDYQIPTFLVYLILSRYSILHIAIVDTMDYSQILLFRIKYVSVHRHTPYSRVKEEVRQ